MMSRIVAIAVAAALLPGTAIAGNTLIAPGVTTAVAKSSLTVRPDREWNKLADRPGRSSETWTLDGDGLNDVTFYGGIENDRALFREVNKHDRPLPHFRSTMLLTDIPTLIENSYRVALATPLFALTSMKPAILSGTKAVAFTYTFTRPDEEVQRKGEGVATVVGGKLYMVTFEAPDIYYFDRDVASFRELVKSAKIDGATG